MRCPTCQEATEIERRWCARCGAPLMFGDERAPAPLDRPLDLDRRWSASAELPAPLLGDPGSDGVAEEEAVRTPPSWWGGGAVDLSATAEVPGAAPAAQPVATPARPSAQLAAPVQMQLGRLEGTPRAEVPRRLLAAAIDGALVIAAGAVPISWAVRPGAVVSGHGSFVACAAFLALLAFTYETLGHALMGATIGKRMLGLRVEGPDGAVPGLGRSVARSALAVAGTAALGVALLSRRGQALHDLVVGTSVVRVPLARR